MVLDCSKETLYLCIILSVTSLSLWATLYSVLNSTQLGVSTVFEKISLRPQNLAFIGNKFFVFFFSSYENVLSYLVQSKINQFEQSETNVSCDVILVLKKTKKQKRSGGGERTGRRLTVSRCERNYLISLNFLGNVMTLKKTGSR